MKNEELEIKKLSQSLLTLDHSRLQLCIAAVFVFAFGLQLSA